MSSAAKPVHWADIQQNTFTRWMNEHIRERGLHCNNLATDLCNGVLLINLMEIISGKSLGRWNLKPRIPAQQLENCEIVVKFIQSEGLPLVNIGVKISMIIN